MSGTFLNPNRPPLGLSFPNYDVRVRARGASFVKGDLVEFDLARVDTDTDSALVNDAVSVFTNVVTPSANQITGALQVHPTKNFFYAVCLGPITEDQNGLVRVQGIVDVNVVTGATNAIQFGSPLSAGATTTALGVDGITGNKTLGIALEEFSSLNETSTISCIFNGTHGLGVAI